MRVQEIYIRPAWRNQWLSFIVIAVLSFFFIINVDPLLSPFILTLLGFVIIRVLINRYKYKYMIGPKGVEIHIGILSQDMTRFEYRHIRGANMKASLMNRIMGIGHITLSTSGMDEDIQIKNIKKPKHYTEMIINQLKDLNE